MELFITKNPKSLGSFSGVQLTVLKERATDAIVGYVFTCENTSYNRYGGSNSWECSYIYLEDGYTLHREENCYIRLWNKESAKQQLFAPMYGGEQESAFIVGKNYKYVDIYAEVAPHWSYSSILKNGVDLFYQCWDKEYISRTLKAKLEGQYIPTSDEVIVYSRRGDEVITAFWDNFDHVMNYCHYKNGEKESLPCTALGLYKVFTDAESLWSAYDHYVEHKDDALPEAPAYEEDEVLPRVHHRRARKVEL